MTVAVRGLCVERRGHPVLHGVDLWLEAGTACAVVGPNGAGKSSLLLALAGVLPRSAGDVRVDGVDPARGPRRRLARHVSLMPQSLDCPFAFTALQVAAMGGAAARSPFAGLGAEDEARARRALEQVGIEGLADRPLTGLSGGERQRVHFAMQLVQDARVVLLDEPTSALDFAGTQAVLDTVATLCAQGHTVIAALHDLNVASVGFSHAVLLRDGRVADHGPTQTVLEGDALGDAWEHAFDRVATEHGVAILPRASRHGAPTAEQPQ
jgi:iron complex transport system ATP-binding protein